MPWLQAIASALLVPFFAHAAPDAELWEKWQSHDAGSTISVDHGPWSEILAAQLYQQDDGTYLVNYNALANQDRRPLNNYIRSLTKTPVSTLNRAEQFAYWVNLYNALTVKTIINNFPVESIRDIDISPGLFSDGPWGEKMVVVEKEPISLDDIEHRILRPIWNDPRVHYAVNCASIGCPDLFPEALTAANSEKYLDQAARAYINHPRGARVEDGRLIASSIYDWFEDDFGGDDAGVIAHLKQYAEGDLATSLAQIQNISEHDYDWALNATELPADYIAAQKAAEAYRLRGGS